MIQFICVLHNKTHVFSMSDIILAKDEASAAKLYRDLLPDSAQHLSISAHRL